MINVYWATAPYVSSAIRAKNLELVSETFLKETSESGLKYCPSIIHELTNLYGLYNINDLSFKIEGNSISQIDDFNYVSLNQTNPILIRSESQKIYSTLLNSIIFYTEEDSLEVSQLPCYLEDNLISECCTVIPGKFDIGKWFRPLEFAWKFKKYKNIIRFRQNEFYCYVKFHTDEKINFRRYIINNKLTDYFSFCLTAKHNKLGAYSLKHYYDLFKSLNIKKNILKEIKNNLC